MTDHSPTAAMFGFCECAQCKHKVDSFIDFDYSGLEQRIIQNTDEWWLFTIRSRNLDALVRHQGTMRRMGFELGGIYVADRSTPYPGNQLAEWDRINQP